MQKRKRKAKTLGDMNTAALAHELKATLEQLKVLIDQNCELREKLEQAESVAKASARLGKLFLSILEDKFLPAEE